MVIKFQVFRKPSPNKKITIFLTKRNYVDRDGDVENISGLVVIDPTYVGDYNVYVEIVLRFFLGNDTTAGSIDRLVKTLHLKTTQVYPPPSVDVPRTDLQEKLIQRLGNFAFPFHLKLPKLGSPSYILQEGWEDDGPCMGVEYSVVAYSGYDPDDTRQGSASVLTVVRHQELPQRLYELPIPRRTTTKSFKTSSGTVTISAAIHKPVYAPEEDIHASVCIESRVVRDIKKVKVKVVQISEVPMFKVKQVRDRTLMKIDKSVFIPHGATFNDSYTLQAKIPPKGPKGQVFLKPNTDPNMMPELAPSTVIHEDVIKRDLFGITVSYAFRVKCTFGNSVLGDATLDVPFYLTTSDNNEVILQ